MFSVRSHFVVEFERLFFVFLDCKRCRPLFLHHRRLFFPRLFGLFRLLVDQRWLHLPFLFYFQFLLAHLQQWKCNLLVRFLLQTCLHFQLPLLQFQFHRLLLLFLLQFALLFPFLNIGQRLLYFLCLHKVQLLLSIDLLLQIHLDGVTLNSKSNIFSVIYSFPKIIFIFYGTTASAS